MTQAVIVNGIDAKGMQGRLGHTLAKTTLGIYTGNDGDTMRRATESTATAMREVPEEPRRSNNQF